MHRFQFSLFIARRLIGSKSHKNSVSAPIIKIGIVAVAIGLTAMHIAVGTGFGLQQKIRTKITSFEGHIRISNYENNSSLITPTPIDSALFASIKKWDWIKNVNLVTYSSAILKTNTLFNGVVLKGVNNNYAWGDFDTFLVAGSLPDIGTDLSTDILISQPIARQLGLQVGDRISAYFMSDGNFPKQRRFEVSGIYLSGFPDFDSQMVFGDIRHLQRINNWEANQVGAAEVILADFDQMELRAEQLYDATPAPLDVQHIKERYFEIFNWISLFDSNIALVIVIMILVGGVNMITALLVLILERTQMIGLLGVMGMRRIQSIFLINAAYLIGWGLFWGNLVGLGLMGIQQATGLVTLDPATYYVDVVPVQFDLGAIIGLNLGTFVICLLMLWIPSFIIAKITPIRAIERR
jgi:lipoprotein-releasing system permease protein